MVITARYKNGALESLKVHHKHGFQEHLIEHIINKLNINELPITLHMHACVYTHGCVLVFVI